MVPTCEEYWVYLYDLDVSFYYPAIENIEKLRTEMRKKLIEKFRQRNCKGSNADVKPSPKEPDSKGYWYPDENPLWATADVRNLSLMCRK